MIAPLTDAFPSMPDVAPFDPPVRPPELALNPSVILVEDDPAVLGLLRLELDAAGFDVTAFDDPIQALMWASDAEPACIVADFRLPGVEGLDLIEAFQAIGRHAVFMISAYVDVRTAVGAMKLGVEDVVQKPVATQTLIDALRTATRSLPSLESSNPAVTFTRRERQVAELIVGGQTAKQIAKTLEISPRTVDFFRTSLLRKTQSPNSAALASALTRLGIGG